MKEEIEEESPKVEEKPIEKPIETPPAVVEEVKLVKQESAKSPEKLKKD